VPLGRGSLLILDSIRLITFAFIGATKGNELSLRLFGVVFLATITAIGGGVFRDLVLGHVPKIMHHDFYATVVVLFGVIYWIFNQYM
jgi:uncharacterized membrane protein YeiH